MYIVIVRCGESVCFPWYCEWKTQADSRSPIPHPIAEKKNKKPALPPTAVQSVLKPLALQHIQSGNSWVNCIRTNETVETTVRKAKRITSSCAPEIFPSQQTDIRSCWLTSYLVLALYDSLIEK